MELILLEKVQNLGNLGDKVNVKPGFGRNYLVPTRKAVKATKDNIEEFEKRRAEFEMKANDTLVAAKARAKSMEAAMVSIPANASSEGKLYGSVGTREIAEAMNSAGYSVEKAEVSLPEGTIRQLGQFEVELRLHADVKVIVTINVIIEE